MREKKWHVTGDTQPMTPERWHMTGDKWHMTHGVGWTFSKNTSSLALTVLELWCFEDLEEKDQLTNDEGVCRTARATPGLLISWTIPTQHTRGVNFQYTKEFFWHVRIKP